MRFIWVFILLLLPNFAFANCLNCNVVLISLDTVGAKHIGAFGGKADTSPNIDAFAKKSRIYTNAYSAAPWTLPAHVAMLTGQYPWSAGVMSPTEKISPQTDTLASLLKKQKYETVAYTGGLYVSRAYGFDLGFDQFTVNGNKTFFAKTFPENVAQAVTWMKTPRRTPFFLFLHTYDVHTPYEPREETLGRLGKSKSKSLSVDQAMAFVKTKPSAAEVEDVRLLYRAGINDVDGAVGNLLKALEAQGLLRNTIVIITADHGEELGEHGNVALHGFTLYDEVLKVPLVVHLPGKPAQKIESPVSLVDIAPSVLSWVGAKTPASWPGQPLPEVDSEKSRKRTVFATSNAELSNLVDAFFKRSTAAESKMKSTPPQVKNWMDTSIPLKADFAMISSTQKLIVDFKREKLVSYDLVKDPSENHPNENPCKDAICQLQLQFILKSGVAR